MYYLIIISVFGAIITIYDKIASKKLPRHRIPEKVLLGVGVAGGALAEFITMKLIRHKTRHRKFMVGLPCIIALHVILIAVYHFYF